MYCYLPKKFKKQIIGTLLFLFQTLYGLKQLPTLWYKNFSVMFIQLKLKPVPRIKCFFISEFLLVFFFVDDIIIIYNQCHKQKTNAFEIDFFKTYKMKIFREFEWFLSIHIKQDKNNKCFWLSQASYIKKITKKFSIAFSRRVQTPLPTETIYRHEGTSLLQQMHLYQQLINSINFAAIVTCLDITYATSMLLKHLINLLECHMELAYKVMHYLN